MKLKKKSGKSIHRVLVDTNLFIAAIKNPKKETSSLRLLLELIDNASIMLIGNEFLIMEMEKYAATCLQEGAVLITNDRHFDKINDEKIIEVWSISKAIKELGI